MPDLPTLSGGPSESSTGAGTTLTAHASNNTKASTWSEVIASTDYASNWVIVQIAPSAANSYLIDVGVGASTAEQTLISNLYCHEPSSSSIGERAFLFPLRIPAGTRLSARCQSSTGGGQCIISIIVIGSGITAPPGLDRVETLGADTSDSNGVSVDCGAVSRTDVVGELIASTGFAYKWMCLAIANPTDVSWVGTTRFLADVCIGAGGSEVAVINDIMISGGSTDDRPSPGAVCFPVAISAGSRVSVRARCAQTVAGDRVLDYVGYGVG